MAKVRRPRRIKLKRPAYKITYGPGLDAVTRAGGSDASIAELFSNGEQGVWLDIRDTLSLFQDAEGTVPVTLSGSAVGLILDKSGNGNNASQSVEADKNIYTVDGDYKYLTADSGDSYSITVPAGGFAGTYIQGTAEGVIVGEVEVPAGPYIIPTNQNYQGAGTNAQTLIVNRTLAAHELDGLVELVGQRCPVEDFATTSTMNSWFRDRTDITALDFSRANATGVTNIAGLALSTANLATIKLGSIISAATTDIGNLVRGTKLTSLDLSDSVTSGVTSCTNFARGTPLETLTLSGGSGSPFSDSPCVSYSGAFIGTNLSQQSYADLVTAIEAAGTSNGTLNITGGSATTTGAAKTAVDGLRTRGWTVTTPDGY